MIETDYLIIGGGAVGMVFADQLLTETDAQITIVDRRHMPGGHWNDAYSFVRLHQPSAYYGAGSRVLGTHRIDETGFNQGYYELASGQEICGYFDALMRERFLPSGRVRYFPMCDHRGGGRLVSLLSGDVHTVSVRRKVVDATYFHTQVPATHTPAFSVAAGVRLVTPNQLPSAAAGRSRFVIVGAGKTAMDVGVWLLQMGARPQAIRWIAPRASWLINRDTVQPGDAFAHRFAGGQADQLEAAADATTVGDLFDRLEHTKQLLRIDPHVKPSMFRGATISEAEVAMLSTIEDVVRMGYVRAIERTRVLLDAGEIGADPGDLYIDCSASGIVTRPSVPIFDADTITVQMVRANLVCMSTAIIAHVEACYDESLKNEVCAPIPVCSSDVDWLRTTLADLQTARRWSADKPLRHWISEHRLSGFGSGAAGPALDAIRARIRDARPRAEANLTRLLAATRASAALR